MNGIEITAIITILAFSVRGMISLIIIIWGGKKIKKYFDKKKQKEDASDI